MQHDFQLLRKYRLVSIHRAAGTTTSGSPAFAALLLRNGRRALAGRRGPRDADRPGIFVLSQVFIRQGICPSHYAFLLHGHDLNHLSCVGIWPRSGLKIRDPASLERLRDTAPWFLLAESFTLYTFCPATHHRLSFHPIHYSSAA